METPGLTAPLSIKACIKEGWHLVDGTKLASLATVLPMLLISLTAYIVMSKVNVPSHSGSVASLIYTLLSPLIDAILISSFLAGLAMLGIKRARGQAVGISDGLKYFNKLPKLACIAYLETLCIFIITNILVFLMAFTLLKLAMHDQATVALITALILLVAVLALKTFVAFSFQLAIDKGLHVLPSIGRSIKIVRRHYWKVLGTLVILMLINILGACIIGLGLFWTLPFSYNTLGVLYRELVDKAV